MVTATILSDIGTHTVIALAVATGMVANVGGLHCGQEEGHCQQELHFFFLNGGTGRNKSGFRYLFCQANIFESSGLTSTALIYR